MAGERAGTGRVAASEQTGARIRVLVADDQAIIRDGLVTVLSLLPDVEIVGEASNGEEAIERVGQLRPDVVLMDLRMPVVDGATATERIVREFPRTAILVLTTFADDDSILGALRAGARGYLTKDAGRSEVASAIRAVAQGQTTFAPEIGAMLINSLTASKPGGSGGTAGAVDASGAGASSTAGGAGSPAHEGAVRSAGGGGEGAVPPASELSQAAVAQRFPVLTQRESEVVALVARGLNNAEIASALFVSVATVKTHINSIFAKLGVRDRAQAITLVRS